MALKVTPEITKHLAPKACAQALVGLAVGLDLRLRDVKNTLPVSVTLVRPELLRQVAEFGLHGTMHCLVRIPSAELLPLLHGGRLGSGSLRSGFGRCLSRGFGRCLSGRLGCPGMFFLGRHRGIPDEAASLRARGPKWLRDMRRLIRIEQRDEYAHSHLHSHSHSNPH